MALLPFAWVRAARVSRGGAYRAIAAGCWLAATDRAFHGFDSQVPGRSRGSRALTDRKDIIMFKSVSNSLILRGVLALIVGIIALAWPNVTILALVILFAVYAFINAGIEGVRAFSGRGDPPDRQNPAHRPAQGRMRASVADGLAVAVPGLIPAWPPRAVRPRPVVMSRRRPHPTGSPRLSTRQRLPWANQHRESPQRGILAPRTSKRVGDQAPRR